MEAQLSDKNKPPKSHSQWIVIPIAILVGAMTAFYWQWPRWLFLVPSILALIHLKQRNHILKISMISLALCLGTHYLTITHLQKRMAQLPQNHHLDKAYKAQVRLLYSWDTRFGKAARFDNITILSPQQTTFKLENLSLYLPPETALPKRGSRMTLWFNLKRRYEPQTIPWPLRRLRETWSPIFYGSVKTPLLMDIQDPPYLPPTHLSQSNRELIQAMLAGMPSKIWQERLRPFGLGHLLAISGLHCGFVFLGLNLLLMGLRRPLIRTSLILSGMVLFAHHIGWTTSVSRATFMLCLWQILPLLQRQRNWIRIWASLASIAIITDPTLLLQRGYWYSFTASLGIILGAQTRPTSPLIHPYLKRLRYFLPIIAAQLMVTPINLLFDAQTHFTSLFWNMLGIVFLILIGLLLSLSLLAWYIPQLATLANTTDTLFEALFNGLMGGQLFTLVRFPPQPLTILIVTISLGLIFAFVAREWRWYAAISTLFVLCLLGQPLKGSKVIMLDVGQGQCIAAINEKGETWLYDAGGRLPAGLRLDQVLYLMGMRSLKGIIISHHNWDHYNLLLSLPQSLPSIFVPPRQQEAFVKNPSFPDSFSFSSTALPPQFGDLTLKQIWPVKQHHPPNNNEGSWVLQLSPDQTSTLILTGDAGLWTESRIHIESSLLESRVVLQIGHHGSRSSTSEGFLEKTGTDIALISCGRRNPFGHPHQYVVERLKKRNIPIFNTSIGGSLLIYEKNVLKVGYIK